MILHYIIAVGWRGSGGGARAPPGRPLGRLRVPLGTRNVPYSHPHQTVPTICLGPARTKQRAKNETSTARTLLRIVLESF